MVSKPFSVLFHDVDGCLFDTEPAAGAIACDVVNEVLALKGCTARYSYSDFTEKFTGSVFRVAMTAAAAENSIHISEDEMKKWEDDEAARIIEIFSMGKFEVAPHVEEALRGALEIGKKLIAISNSMRPRLDVCFRVTGLDRLIPEENRISAQSDFSPPRPKPDPAAIEKAVKLSGDLDTEAFIGTEDSPSGVKAYASAFNGKGVPVVAFTGLVPKSELDGRIKRLKSKNPALKYFFDDWRRYLELISAIQSSDARVLSAFRL